MRKIFAAAVSVLLICLTAACSSAKTSGTTEAAAASEPVTSEAAETTAPAAQISSDDANMKEALEELAEQGFGGVIYIEKGGKPFASYAGGTLNGGVAVTLDTPMPIGSVSKQFCAAAVLLLQEQGRLSVKDTLDKYYPEWAEASKITLHDLLDHRSGVPEFSECDFDLKSVTMDNTGEENMALVLNWLFGKTLDFEPGSKFHYSNTNYMLLGNIVEKASGKTYAEYLRENIFEPLGMDHTGFVTELKDSPGWAEGFSYEPSELSVGIEPGIAKGAGDIVSTAADMTLWLNALPSGKVISAEGVKAMTTSYSEGTPYGYGIYTELGSGAGHFGSIGIFSSAAVYIPEKKVTVFMASNTAGETISQKYFRLEGFCVT